MHLPSWPSRHIYCHCCTALWRDWFLAVAFAASRVPAPRVSSAVRRGRPGQWHACLTLGTCIGVRQGTAQDLLPWSPRALPLFFFFESAVLSRPLAAICTARREVVAGVSPSASPGWAISRARVPMPVTQLPPHPPSFARRRQHWTPKKACRAAKSGSVPLGGQKSTGRRTRETLDDMNRPLLGLEPRQADWDPHAPKSVLGPRRRFEDWSWGLLLRSGAARLQFCNS